MCNFGLNRRTHYVVAEKDGTLPFLRFRPCYFSPLTRFLFYLFGSCSVILLAFSFKFFFNNLNLSFLQEFVFCLGNLTLSWWFYHFLGFLSLFWIIVTVIKCASLLYFIFVQGSGLEPCFSHQFFVFNFHSQKTCSRVFFECRSILILFWPTCLLVALQDGAQYMLIGSSISQ